MNLDDLNPQQREAVEYIQGSLLVLSPAGAGKTEVLTRRIANMIEHGVNPRSILAVTFTNKAANELKDRVRKLVPVDARDIWVGTFHSIALRMMRSKPYVLDAMGYEGNFTIYDKDDSLSLIKLILKEMGLSAENVNGKSFAREVVDRISLVKMGGFTPEQWELQVNDRDERLLSRIYNEYQARLLINNSMDFDDIIGNCVRMLENDEHFRDHFQMKFQYVSLDEVQDCNTSQYRFAELIATPHNNVFAVGDPNQCIAENSTVETKSGMRLVKDLCVGDSIKTIYSGCISYSKVTNKSFSGCVPTLVIKTKSGHSLEVSTNHKMFVSMPSFESAHYVYLMYRVDKGFRIGVTSGGKTKDIRARTASEHPHKVWILAKFDNKSDAAFAEQDLSLRYKIPMIPFFHNGRNILLSQDKLDILFDLYGMNGQVLLDVMGLCFDLPNYIPQNITRDNTAYHRHVVIYLANAKGSCLVTFESNGQRIRKQFSGSHAYLDAVIFADSVADTNQCEVIEKYSFPGEGYLNVIPAAGIVPSMKIPVIVDGKVVLSEVLSIEKSMASVYDIEIARTGIVIANNIISHNSIYAFRGAKISIIMNFAEKYGAKVITLEENYRSTQTIIDAASHVISNNSNPSGEIWTKNGVGDPIYLHRSFSDLDEASWIGGAINSLVKMGHAQYKDFAVLYRTNSVTRILEGALLSRYIPYYVVGGTSFYERKEIRDMLSYLRLICNPYDDVAFLRVVNEPKRGIGGTTIERLSEVARADKTSLWEAIDKVPTLKLSTKIKYTLLDFKRMISDLAAPVDALLPMDISTIYEMLCKRSGYEDSLNTSEDGKGRIPNVKKLGSLIKDYALNNPGCVMSGFLQDISLLSDIDSLKESDDAVKLMTVHNAKGLEFPIVFIASVEKGSFPHYRTRDDVEEEEERRLFYVAMTRAKKILYMSYACSRMSYDGVSKEQEKSKFLDEIPAKFIVSI